MDQEVKDQIVELWHECGNRDAWRCGLTERLAKTLVHLSITRELSESDQSKVESALLNYSMREVLLGL